MINITYILLANSVLLSFFTKNKIFLLSLIFLTSLLAVYQNIINLFGFGAIAAFFIVCHFYFHYKNLGNKALEYTGFIGIILFVNGFLLHSIPGIFNTLVLNKIQVSDFSYPYSMYLNFDKTIIALLLYITSHLYVSEQSINRQSALKLFRCLSACVGFILIPGLLSKYVRWDPKLPDILGIWMFNNLLFVCFSEEVIFRGFLQNHLKRIFTTINIPFLHIIITSCIFGLYHFSGGPYYMVLAAICGGFYGYAYEKTNRIVCAILVHFGLNLTHLIFFTYPAAIKILPQN